MIYVFLADGFEVTEALATVDVLRRAKLPVTTVGIGSEEIQSSHGITVLPDVLETDLDFDDMTAVVLPGGMPGTINLENSATVQSAIKYAVENNKFICAICAAPSILGHLGLLDGKNATCFPGFEVNEDKVNYTDEPAVADGKIITGKGAGAAVEFALKIVSEMVSKEVSDEIRSTMQCP